MIAHETPRVNLPARPLTGLGESLDETTAILIIDKNVFAPIAAVHDVIDGTGILDSKFARHAGEPPSTQHQKSTLSASDTVSPENRRFKSSLRICTYSALTLFDPVHDVIDGT